MMNFRPLAEAVLLHFQEQTERYETILTLSKQQLDPIRIRDSTMLMALLSQKQRVIHDIDQAEARMKDSVAQWQDNRESIPESLRAPVLEAYEALCATLKAVINCEEESRGALSRSQQDKQQEIIKLQKGKQLHKAYGATPPLKSRFTDKKK